VLTYHAIGPERSPLSTDPSRFSDTLTALLESGHQPVDLEEWVLHGRPRVARGFAVAFDDGLRSILGVADLLARSRVPATVFLVTDRVGLDNGWPGQPGWVDIEPTLSWSEVAELARLGIRFGSHGATHARLDVLGHSWLLRELSGSLTAIADRTGRTPRLLAYPYGHASPLVRQAAARYYAAAFGTTLGSTTARQDLFDLARIDAYYLRDSALLAALIEGRGEGRLRWRRALRAIRRGAGSVHDATRRAA
jgi:peptidoglycan/xylan/chitin deacetylase (PgdA/CDA1 family)